MKSYLEQCAEAYMAGDMKKGLAAEKAGAEHITRKLADTIETFHEMDAPFVLVALRNLQQIMERQAGESGVKIANGMMQHLNCVDLTGLET